MPKYIEVGGEVVEFPDAMTDVAIEAVLRAQHARSTKSSNSENIPDFPNTPQGKEILGLQRATRFVPTQASNYNGIRAAAENAGLLK